MSRGFIPVLGEGLPRIEKVRDFGKPALVTLLKHFELAIRILDLFEVRERISVDRLQADDVALTHVSQVLQWVRALQILDYSSEGSCLLSY